MGGGGKGRVGGWVTLAGRTSVFGCGRGGGGGDEGGGGGGTGELLLLLLAGLRLRSAGISIEPFVGWM